MVLNNNNCINLKKRQKKKRPRSKQSTLIITLWLAWIDFQPVCEIQRLSAVWSSNFKVIIGSSQSPHIQSPPASANGSARGTGEGSKPSPPTNSKPRALSSPSTIRWHPIRLFSSSNFRRQWRHRSAPLCDSSSQQRPRFRIQESALRLLWLADRSPARHPRRPLRPPSLQKHRSCTFNLPLFLYFPTIELHQFQSFLSNF